MDPLSGIGAIFAAVGLSGAAGLNAWIPLLTTAVAGRAGWLDLGEDFSALESTPALIAIGAAFVTDFVGDKIPGVDHVLHLAGAVVQPAAGAILFAAQTGVAGDMDPTVALVLGAVVSGTVHAGRAGARPVSTASTGGLGNPVLSFVEDLGSVGLTALAFLLPLVALLVVVGVVVLLVRAWLRVRAIRAGRAARRAP